MYVYIHSKIAHVCIQQIASTSFFLIWSHSQDLIDDPTMENANKTEGETEEMISYHSIFSYVCVYTSVNGTLGGIQHTDLLNRMCVYFLY